MFTAYVINLNHRTDRLEKFYRQPDSHYFQRVPAVDRAMLNLCDNGQLNYFFDTIYFHQVVGREVTAGEVACTLSHIKCWHLIAQNPDLNNDDFAIIAEDDVQLCPDFAEKIQSVFRYTQQVNYDVLILQHLFWQNNADLSLAMQKVNQWYFWSSEDNQFFDFNSSALYAIRKARAIELVAYLSQYKPYWLADHFSCFCAVEKMSTISPLLGVVPDGIHAQSDLETERYIARHQAHQQHKNEFTINHQYFDDNHTT